jgi:hypothetical protein
MNDIALNHFVLAVVPDDDFGGISEEDAQQPPRLLTPPTPPVHAQPSPSPPRPIRQRAEAQLRPVSIPIIVSNMAGSDPSRRRSDLDRHYMPDGDDAIIAYNRLGFCNKIIANNRK